MLATSTAATSGGGRGTGIQHSLNLQATNLGEGEELKSRYPTARETVGVHSDGGSHGRPGRCRYRGSDEPYLRAVVLMSRPIAKPAPTASSRGALTAVRTTKTTAPARAAKA